MIANTLTTAGRRLAALLAAAAIVASLFTGVLVAQYSDDSGLEAGRKLGKTGNVASTVNPMDSGHRWIGW